MRQKKKEKSKKNHKMILLSNLKNK